MSAVKPLKVAYMMSRFPKLTETFILYEILAVEQQGVAVDLYPLLREKTEVMHPEAVPLVERAHFQPFFSGAIARANLRFFGRKPLVYVRTLWDLLRHTFGSVRFFVGAVGIFPKSVYFAQMMTEAGIDHIHAHFASHPAAAAFVIHRLTGIPYSFTAHGSDLHRDRHMLREKTAEAAFVVAISNFNREIIVRESGEAARPRVLIVHCGVDTSVFQPQAEAKPAADGFNILCIGTLHEVKGQTHLIEACRLLKERGVPFVCHFVGDGPDRPMLTEQVERAGLQPQVCFHGRLARQDVVKQVQQAQVVVAPSVPSRDGRREGIPVVLIEAMSSGRPVVASRLSGIPELVDDQVNGLLTEPGDAAALADALQQLSTDLDLRQRLGQAGREKVASEFDLTTNAARLIRCFGGETE